MSNTSALPKRLPVLKAKDIHRGGPDGPNRTHCLLGWSRTLLKEAEFAMDKEMARASGTHLLLLDRFNDDPKNSKSKVASVWNRAAKSLGYVKSKTGKFFFLPKQKRGAK